jgi:hypothetical protein
MWRPCHGSWLLHCHHDNARSRAQSHTGTHWSATHPCLRGLVCWMLDVALASSHCLQLVEARRVWWALTAAGSSRTWQRRYLKSMAHAQCLPDARCPCRMAQGARGSRSCCMLHAVLAAAAHVRHELSWYTFLQVAASNRLSVDDGGPVRIVSGRVEEVDDIGMEQVR